MKTISALLIFVVLGLSAGCQQATDYKEVSIANMGLSIPESWFKTAAYNDLIEDCQLEHGFEAGKCIPFDIYQVSGEDVFLILGVESICNCYAREWPGSKSISELHILDSFCPICALASGVLVSDIMMRIAGRYGVAERNQQISQHLINGCDALEMGIEYKVGGETHSAYILSIFGTKEIGMVFMGGRGTALKKYEETWQKVRNSVRIM